MVLDADALMLINEDPGLIKGCKEVILTPNVVEFARLAKALGADLEHGKPEEACATLTQKLGGVCIVQKGAVDSIAAGEGEQLRTAVCDVPGGKKRSGGQGDTLTGSLGTLLAWREAYHEGLWEDQGAGDGKRMTREETLLLAAFGGSAITRECSRRAFVKKGRSLQASDLTDEVYHSFCALLGEDEGVGGGKVGEMEVVEKGVGRL